MSEIEKYFAETKEYIDLIQQKFLASHMPVDPGKAPSTYEYDVKSYIILSHAAIEEFIESIALYVLEKSIELYLQNRYTKPLLSLLSSSEYRLEVPDEKSSEVRSFDNIRKILDQYKAYYSKLIYENHGISLKYMRKLFYPISIDLPTDLKLIGAVDWIADYRGTFAHKRTFKKIPSPEDSIEYINDCVGLCKAIRDQAESLFP